MKNNCWLCGGTRRHSEHMMREFLINGRLIYIGKLCLETIVIQHVLDFESKDKAMSERANRHEAELIEESITKHVRDCRCDKCERTYHRYITQE